MNETEAILRQQIHAHINSRRKEIYDSVKELGKKAAQAFPKDQRQMRSLENLAFRSRSVVDLFDFIKNQTGKSNKDEKWLKGRFGPELLEQLVGLSTKAEQIARVVGLAKDGDDWRRWLPVIHQELARETIRYLVSDYLYNCQEVKYA